MTKEEIFGGHIYAAKKPRPVDWPLKFNDRLVIWISPDKRDLQYDGPAVKSGVHYPTITMDKFLKWAGRDVTAIMPIGTWRAWSAKN